MPPLTTLESLTWPMILLGGFLGSSHCVGMCGGFAMTVGATANSWKRNLVRQLVYSCGRLGAYATAGALVGVLGLRLSRWLPTLHWGQAALAVLAGGLLLVQGLKSAGCWPAVKGRAVDALCPMRGGFAALLRSGEWPAVFVAGFATGWLPCGLVYAFLALAAQSQSLIYGMLTMLVFGTGTIPLMVLTGLAPGCLSLTLRRRLLKCAAWAVVFVGLLTIARGGLLAKDAATEKPAVCPFCTSSAE